MKKVGEIALELAFIRPHQLQKALEKQKEYKQKILLGKLLLKLKYINPHQHAILVEEINKQKKKKVICLDWIERYTGHSPTSYGKYIIFTNFYDHLLAACDIYGKDARKLNESKMMPALKLSEDIWMVCIRMGSPNMALAIDIFSALNPECYVFIGKCGGIKRLTKIGDFILPSSAIRAEGTSNDYLDPIIPALPAYRVHSFLAEGITQKKHTYLTGVVHTTNRRLWEFDNIFCQKLITEKVIAVDMETATFFSVSFANKVAAGALLLISDLPLVEVKTKEKDKRVSKKSYSQDHIKIAYEALTKIKEKSTPLRHYGYSFY